MKTYLSGTIEFATGKEESWREVVKDKFASSAIEFIDPVEIGNKILQCHGLDNESFKQLKLANLEMYRDIMLEIADEELTAIRSCDNVLTYLSNTRSDGTAGEVTFAYWYQIPVVGWMPEIPITDISGWTCALLTDFTTSLDEAIRLLESIHYAKFTY